MSVRNRRLQTRETAEASHPSPGEVFEGAIEGVVEGRVLARLEDGRRIEARRPAHVDRAWLEAAVAVGPVEAAFVFTRQGRALLWGVFPGPQHEQVRADVTLRARRVVVDAESVRLQAPRSHLEIGKDGDVEVRGRDVTSRASRINRVKGAAVRVN